MQVLRQLLWHKVKTGGASIDCQLREVSTPVLVWLHSPQSLPVQVERNSAKRAFFHWCFGCIGTQDCHCLVVSASSSQPANLISQSGATDRQKNSPRTSCGRICHVFWLCSCGKIKALEEHGQQRSCQKMEPLADSKHSRKTDG